MHRIDLFQRLFGVALVGEVATQAWAGVWAVHAGHLYPWRHLGILPLYPPWAVGVEWALVVACGGALIFGPRAATGLRALAWRVLVPVLLVGVLERYSNHVALMFLVALFAALAPPDLSDVRAFDSREHPNLELLRAQLVIVYLFSALSKLLHGFASGASLQHLLHLEPRIAAIASWMVMAAELAAPALVWRLPRIGIAAIALMHAAFAVAIPGVVSFGLTMLAMAVLFLPSARYVPR